MLRFIAQTILTIIGNALGLLAAMVLLDDFHISGLAFGISVLFFSAAQIILSPFILKLAIKYAPALRGGIALVTTFIALFLTAIVTDGLDIRGISTWLIAPFIIWVCTVVAGILLPLMLFKKTISRKNDLR